MGRLCRVYSAYYFVLFVIFVTIGLAGIILLSGVAADCQAICPLQTQSDESAQNPIAGEACTGQKGYCLGTDACTPKADILAMTPEEANGQGCFICEGSAGVEKWQPAGSCAGKTSGGAQENDYQMCWSVPSEVSLRAFATPGLWLLTLTHLVQSIGCCVCAFGMKHFGHKYADDWKKLTDREVYLGMAVKLFPKVNRVLNTATMVFIFLGLAMLFGVGVCKEAENSFGEAVFYPQATAFMLVSLLGFVVTCLGGTVFRRVVPFETPFYQPRMRPDEDANKVVRNCWEPTLYYYSMLGP